MGTPRDERYEGASVRVASRREDVASETMMDDSTIHARVDGQNGKRARNTESPFDETLSRFFDWKKSYVYGTKKSLFSKKMKISWVGIWCRV